MCGLPFSGKTTYSKDLENDGYERISFDELWKELENKGRTNLTWEIVRDAAKEKITTLLQKGKSVVYDDTNLAKSHRKDILDIGKKFAAKTKIVFFDIALEEILERQSQNQRNRHNVDDVKVKNALSQLEKPNENEADELIVIEVN